MSIEFDDRLAAILEQAKWKIPAVLMTKQGQPLWLIMPYTADGSAWLQEGHSRHSHRYIREGRYPHWNVPKAWLPGLVKRLMARFGACYLVQTYRELEKCAPACWNASGLECSCSCMGENHGDGHPGGRWYEISETCAVSWGELKLSCKLLRPRTGPKRPSAVPPLASRP